MKLSSCHCKLSLILILLIFQFPLLHSAYLRNVPQIITQPDGTVAECYSSGDEFYNWLHDKDGYTIVINPKNHYYVYALKAGSELIHSDYIIGKINPQAIGLQKWLSIPSEKIKKKRQEYYEKMNKIDLETNKLKKNYTPEKLSQGTLENIVIFIRFADEAEFTDNTSFMDSLFNLENSISLNSYYKEVSYGNLSINSSYYPKPSGNKIISYKDQYNRSYYMPYDEYYNPDGFKQGQDNNREWILIENAFKSVANSIPKNFPIGNVCFVVSGKPGAWSTLLWPHMSHHSAGTEINGNKVDRYNLQLREGGIFHVEVLAHEMFHTLGAPDLYHYQKNGISPAGRWDLMDAGTLIPTHMLMFMKYKYGEWINSIPEITENGIYTLNPVTSQNNNCYKIKSPVSDQEYFVLEYRNKNYSAFESVLPGSGLIIYRINELYRGNSNGPPDEVYVYRPNGTIEVNGYPNDAYFNAEIGRTALNDTTNPSSFLTDGSLGYLNISDVSIPGDYISFKVSFNFPFLAPKLMYPKDNSIEVPLLPEIYFSWGKSADADSYHVQIALDSTFNNIVIEEKNIRNTIFIPSVGEINYEEKYYWRVRAVKSNDSSEWSNFKTFATEAEHKGILVWDGNYNCEGYSGRFISDFLKAQELDCQYRAIFPSSFTGFDAVFLLLGVYDESKNSSDLNNQMFDVIINYLESGGKIYLEGGIILSALYYYNYNRGEELANLTGMRVNKGDYYYKNNSAQITGIDETFAKGMKFPEIKYNSYFYCFTPEPTSAEAVLVENSDPGDTVAFINSGGFKQKVFFYAYQLVNLIDGQFPSTRYELLYQIMNFFDLGFGTNYLGVELKTDTTTGNMPHNVHFINNTKLRSGIKPDRYEWDFEEDGIIDSEEESPNFIYQKSGIYIPSLKIKFNNNEYKYKSKDTIYVFDGESSAEFNSTRSDEMKIPLGTKIDPVKPFTIEGWINPYSSGEFNNGAFAYLTASIGINLTYDKKIKLTVKSDDRREEYFETKNPCIEYNKWQHLAVAFNGNDDAHIYIDSTEQEVILLHGSEYKGEVFNELNPDANYLSFGNYPDIEISSYSFNGKIDEIRFWDEIRNLPDIQKYMNDTSLTGLQGLIGYWRMNEGKGNIINDKSGNTLNGFAESAWRQGWNPPGPTSIEEDEQINNIEFNFYPNPAISIVKIIFNMNPEDNINLSLYDLFGNEIEPLRKNYNQINKNEINLNLDNLSSGIYFVRMTSSKKTVSMPLVIMK